MADPDAPLSWVLPTPRTSPGPDFQLPTRCIPVMPLAPPTRCGQSGTPKALLLGLGSDVGLDPPSLPPRGQAATPGLPPWPFLTGMYPRPLHTLRGFPIPFPTGPESSVDPRALLVGKSHLGANYQEDTRSSEPRRNLGVLGSRRPPSPDLGLVGLHPPPSWPRNPFRREAPQGSEAACPGREPPAHFLAYSHLVWFSWRLQLRPCTVSWEQLPSWPQPFPGPAQAASPGQPPTRTPQSTARAPPAQPQPFQGILAFWYLVISYLFGHLVFNND